ncbi:hypothetical protein [Paractinoplanes atraurantiacus]|uniref:Uncharacterized protein n=1 Tax=Paractinoplanes atraurantiacus TaxID=1036182 RepID=A0A285F028_9ACTN|nr:hypothetical protein [Actinoplanes atraurantiacus]SNY03756.1 hypothetical protein SAMN05421748_10111 [Actinoplanes atraurantiacus]
MSPYQLARPTLQEAHCALHGMYGPHTEDIWRTLLFTAGLSGEESSAAALDRVLAVMATAEPLIRLCARSLQVRIAAHDQLARAHSAQ